MSKIYSNDPEFQKIVKEFTLETINESIEKAVNISEDTKNKDNANVSEYLFKLKELRAIDSNCKIITDTEMEETFNV